MDYVQSYLQEIGERKCEANALVIAPTQGRLLCREAIENYLGEDAVDRFEARRQTISDKMEGIREKAGLRGSVKEAIRIIDGLRE